jgi:Ca2+-binding EF-hand superfamily protein
MKQGSERKPEQDESEESEEIYYKNSKRIRWEDFKELFKFEENERDKKDLKKDFKKLDKKHNGKLKFKHLIDFYLTSSEQFG